MENLADFSAEELLSIKGGLAEDGNIIVNCQAEGSGHIVKPTERPH